MRNTLGPAYAALRRVRFVWLSCYPAWLDDANYAQRQYPECVVEDMGFNCISMRLCVNV